MLVTIGNMIWTGVATPPEFDAWPRAARGKVGAQDRANLRREEIGMLERQSYTRQPMNGLASRSPRPRNGTVLSPPMSSVRMVAV
ncbi:MAG: hypothetical protein R3C56_18230 [Pirellulaceae bacterium]